MHRHYTAVFSSCIRSRQEYEQFETLGSINVICTKVKKRLNIGGGIMVDLKIWAYTSTVQLMSRLFYEFFLVLHYIVSQPFLLFIRLYTIHVGGFCQSLAPAPSSATCHAMSSLVQADETCSLIVGPPTLVSVCTV